MKRTLFVLVLALALPALAQEQKPPPRAAKPERRPIVHTRPTPQQIRAFNALEKKEEKKQARLGDRARK
jgi:hypothetical protein